MSVMRASQIFSCAVVIATTTIAFAQNRELSLEDTLRAVFQNSPAFRIYSEQTRGARAARLRAAGAFDVVATTNVQAQRVLWPTAYGEGILGDQGYSDILLQAGVSTRTRQNLSLQLTGSIPLISSLDPLSSPDQPQVTASLTLPLLKLGRAAAFGAEEHAAELHANAVAALEFDAESEFIARVAEGYWRWVGSYAQVKWSRRLEALARDQVNDIDQLIAQHARAAVDRLAFAAAAENASARRIQAEQTMFEQQQALWATIGLPAPEVYTVPRDELPAVELGELDGDGVARRAHQSALSRPLIKALNEEAGAYGLRAEAARIGARPDLNLVGQATLTRIAAPNPSAGMQALADSAASTVSKTELGYYGLVALQFSYPLQNRAAKGAFAEAEASRAQVELGNCQRRQSVDLRIDALASALVKLRRSYLARAKAADELKQSYDAQRIKFRLGTATAMDVILAEEQFMTASLATVVDQTSNAVALARLQNEAGRLTLSVQSRDPAAIVRALSTSPF